MLSPLSWRLQHYRQHTRLKTIQDCLVAYFRYIHKLMMHVALGKTFSHLPSKSIVGTRHLKKQDLANGLAHSTNTVSD